MIAWKAYLKKIKTANVKKRSLETLFDMKESLQHLQLYFYKQMITFCI